MVKKLIKAAMKKSNAEKFLPRIAVPEKIIDEVSEHFGTVRWGLKRIILPLAAFYVIVGFVLGEHVLGALFTGLVVFLYASFLPDLDAFFPNSSKRAKVSGTKKRIALFFTPIVIYYILSKKTKQWNLGSEKPFHNKKAMLEFTFFLFALGLILYFSVLKAFFLALFGFLGFLTHLIADNRLDG